MQKKHWTILHDPSSLDGKLQLSLISDMKYMQHNFLLPRLSYMATCFWWSDFIYVVFFSLCWATWPAFFVSWAFFYALKNQEVPCCSPNIQSFSHKKEVYPCVLTKSSIFLNYLFKVRCSLFIRFQIRTFLLFFQFFWIPLLICCSPSSPFPWILTALSQVFHISSLIVREYFSL